MKITLPTIEQLDNSKVIEKYEFGLEAQPTDFYRAQEGKVYHGLGAYWTKTPVYDDKSWHVWVVDPSLFFDRYDNGFTYADWYGVRPIIPLSEIYKSTQNINRKIINGVEVIEYGEYPQSMVEEKLEKEVENLYQKNILKKTEKIYTSMQYEHKKEYQEYEYKGNKYIRIRVKKRLIYKRDEKTYWIKVEPIKWLVDKKEKIAISEKILSVMPFSYDNNYEKSYIKNFLENYFIKEIQPSKINENINEEKINDLMDLISMLYSEEKQKEKILKK